MTEDLNGRVVVVTGGGGGIGSEIVAQLVRSGAEVIAAGRTEEELDGVRSAHGVRGLVFDVSDEDGVEAALAGLDLYGLVNCAGFGGLVAPFVDAGADMFDRVMSVNARGTFLATKYAARSMIRVGRGGSIVNISSQAGLVALQGHASYAASKAAVDGMTRVAALELGPHGIRVNSVNPTVVMTPMSASYWGQPEIEQPFLAAMPLGRWATEADIAAPVVFLLGDGARMITGVSLPVDGGYTAR
ncbi:SDR family oxidoreductase [Herbiconiux sp. YIM B11900]|uniref:SDR family oxidoreductase n=1 Tax=Herbiconiux sp. YIM B11900 TaxID=3404131 RepID=UPI003F86BA2E